MGVQKMALRKIFGSKMMEATGGPEEVQNKEYCHLYFSPNIIRMIKLKRMRWVGHMPCMMAKWIQEFSG
jgi:hypothetical protein